MIATQTRCDPSQVEAARHVALLRWSGCTANAQEFADFLEDDVQGRSALLASQKPRMAQPPPRSVPIPNAMLAMANIHCEIAGDIANTLGLGLDTEAALRAIFETYDGGGVPGLLQGNDVPLATYVVALASDLEIFSRLYGLDEALALLQPWVSDANPNIRRFASELTRPRGVWCAQIDALKTEPWRALPLIEPLRADPSRYVQNSVANWLNDASKSQGEWVDKLCARWVAESDMAETRYIAKRAMRTLSK
ncbi:hypothetical protein ACSFA3_24340 [Variovorax sp. RHLX14]|uniref:hypothetical protein n=1 Tax=Variovorax sp. RHLX14 TaxID=1259731 RepID=UPI003F48B978